MPTQQKIKYEAERDLEFARWVEASPGGERIRHCIQCGLCSAACPLSLYMDYTPRRLMNLAREGFKGDVLGSHTLWLCASCYSCRVECPKQIKVTDIMYALKRRAIEEGVTPSRFPAPALAKTFFKFVQLFGRQTESWLITLLYLRTNPFKLLGQAKLGTKLFFKGRMNPMIDRIEGREELGKILDEVSK